MVNPEPEAERCLYLSPPSEQQREIVLNFVNLVRSTFQQQPETFREFMKLMKDFANERISSDHHVYGIHLLFKKHKELLKEFNQLIPDHYKGCFCLRGLDFADALAFPEKIKRRFKPWVYRTFFGILDNYKKGTYDRADAFFQVSRILHGHHDLLMEYWKYLPPII